MSVKRIVKMTLAAPAFVVLAASTAGAALAPTWGQPAVLGAFAGGLIMLVVLVAV